MCKIYLATSFCTRIHAYIYEVNVVMAGFHAVHTESIIVIRNEAVYLTMLSGHSSHTHSVSVPHL